MTHSAFGPTVSLEEAQKIEKETAERLLKARKLSLIVDLDQTIVHATVDPTVGEWIAEGEAWEARQAKKAEAATISTNSDSESDDTDEDEDECNPNWHALKDVRKFQLGPEAFGVPLHKNPLRSKGKQKHIENQGCMYYIKPRYVLRPLSVILFYASHRPGSQDFLRRLSSNYEMHVYTMGTRAYAEEVCAAIDSDGTIFGGRILSRDESESQYLRTYYAARRLYSPGLTQKSLQRLFPCDTSMVVIIDDRADVWEWSPNLIKVIPCEFVRSTGHAIDILSKMTSSSGSGTSTPRSSQRSSHWLLRVTKIHRVSIHFCFYWNYGLRQFKLRQGRSFIRRSSIISTALYSTQRTRACRARI